MKKYLLHNNAYQPNMLLDFTISYDKDIPNDDICRTVVEVVEGVNLGKYINFSISNPHGYDRVMMFTLVILAKTLFGYTSTRQLESLCKTDIRFMMLSQRQKPSHMAFQRFINDCLKESIEDIFYDINKYLEKEMMINTDVLCIDGTKYEANANKNTFIWRKNVIRNRNNTWKKCMEAIKKLNDYFKMNSNEISYSILKTPNIPYLVEITDTIETCMKDANIQFVYGKGHKKSNIQKIYDEFKELGKKMFSYELQLDMLGERNSCSKIDPDATFMHMKYDYYNHTNVFKPGYNIQFGVSDGIIRSIYISSDGNDLRTFIPHLKVYKRHYGRFPLRTPADAGYGSYDNYKFCIEHGIELFMKYSGFYKENEKATEKNRFHSRYITKDEEGNYYCAEGHPFELLYETEDSRSLYKKTNKHYVNNHCKNCPFKKQCTKAERRTFTVCEELNELKTIARKNVTSTEGIQYMIQRSTQTEGTFGDLKYNQEYDRLRRRGESGVELELFMVAIGHNIRKYHNFKNKKERNQIN